MKKLKFFILFILCAILLSCSTTSSEKDQNAKQTPTPAEKKGDGQIEFLKEIHNFGSLIDGEVVSFTFLVINNSTETLKITGVENACGCIVVNYDKNLILPGSKTGIETIFNSSGEWGNVIKSINVKFSNGKQSTLTLYANVENSIFKDLINN